MLFSTVGQWRVFVAMMVAGLLTGLLYGVFSLLRRLLRAGSLLSLAADLAFGVLSAVILGAALTFANRGEPRLYAFLGAGLGMALYFLGLHRLGRAVCRRIVRAIRQLFRRIAKFRLIKVIFR